MTPEPGDGQRPRVAAAVPTNHKTALDYVATVESTPGNRKYTADVIRDAIELYLSENYEDLPEEARDLLDDDLVADAGGTEDDGLRADKFECASCGQTFIDAETASKHTAREHPESDPNIAEVKP